MGAVLSIFAACCTGTKKQGKGRDSKRHNKSKKESKHALKVSSHSPSGSSPASYDEYEDGKLKRNAPQTKKSLGLPAWPAKRFTLQKVLGRGSFGTVMIARDNLDTSSEQNLHQLRLQRFVGTFSSFRSVVSPNRRQASLQSRSSSASENDLHMIPEDSSTASQEESSEFYAVKRISKARLGRKARNDVKKEIMIHSALGKSINVVGIYGAYEDDDYVYIVLELCLGGVLYKRIKQGNYSERTASGYVRSMLRVLAQCHSNGIVYRDLKPDNFLFLNEEQDSPLKATDFGLAAYCTSNKKLSDVTGTPYYMAPEVVRGHYSREADLWSLGITVYQLLTGELPFKHDPNVRGRDASIQVLRRVLHQNINMDNLAHVSESAKNLVQRLLCRDPSSRMTVEEALRHDWVRLDGDAPTTSLSYSVVQRLQHFGTYSWLKQRALLAMVSIINTEVTPDNAPNPELVEVFSDASDRNLELTTNYVSTDQVRKNVTWDSIMSSSNSSASIAEDFDERVPTSVFKQAEEIAEMFSSFDKDGNGSLDFEEIKTALKSLDFRISEAEMEQLFNEMDIDRSGLIDYEEFMATLFNWASMAETRQWEQLVREVFNKIDADGNGKITVSELREMFEDTTGECDAEFSTAVAEEMLQNVDENDDGEIDFDEFSKLLQSCSVEDYHMYATGRSFNKIFGESTLDHIRRSSSSTPDTS